MIMPVLLFAALVAGALLLPGGAAAGNAAPTVRNADFAAPAFRDAWTALCDEPPCVQQLDGGGL